MCCLTCEETFHSTSTNLIELILQHI
uniref:Uncharacterized protein n=1 Tax=Arundo donax TaxID=35708 RepID=A0A0A8Y680_ARUDO